MFLRLRRVMLALIIADAVVTQGVLFIADLARRYFPLGEPLGPTASIVTPILQVMVGVIFPLTFFALAVYDVRRGARPVGDPMNLARAITVATFVFAGFLYFSYRDTPRLWVVYFFILELAALSGIRLVGGLLLRTLRQQGRPISRVLVVGNGEAAAALMEAVQSQMGDSVAIVGCADDSGESGTLGIPHLGKLAEVPRLARQYQVDEVIIALPSSQYEAVENLAYALLTEPVRVRLVPDFMRLVVVQSSVESLGGIPLIGLREPRIAGMTWALKRVFDVVVSALGIVFGWPIMVLIALAIKLDSRGPIIFSQQRVGENGKLFWMHKFRTMVSNADMIKYDVALDANGQQIYKRPDDKRVTRIGKFLRRTSLDELPQLWNIIKGEMSLVGPRPELQFIVDTYEPWQRQRLAVPPGLTGWWQVSGRSSLPMHLNTHLDLYYIRNYSLWLDMVILWKTVGAVLGGRGAY